MPWAARAFAVYTMVGKCLTRAQIEMLSGFPVCCVYAATVTLMCDQFGIGRRQPHLRLLGAVIILLIDNHIVCIVVERARRAGSSAVCKSHPGCPGALKTRPDGRGLAAKYGRHANDHWGVDELLQLTASTNR